MNISKGKKGRRNFEKLNFRADRALILKVLDIGHIKTEFCF